MKSKKLQIFKKVVGPEVTDTDLKAVIGKAQKFNISMVALYKLLKWTRGMADANTGRPVLSEMFEAPKT